MAEEQLPPGLEPVTDPSLIAVLEQPQSAINKGEGGATAPYSQSALDAFDRAISTAQRLKKHPGFGAMVGSGFDPQSWGKFNPLTGEPIAGTSARDFKADLEAMKAQVFLPMVQSMKGMGALSNAEGQKLTDAIGALDTGQSEDAFKASLDRIIGDLTSYRNRGDPSKAQQGATAPPAPPAAGPGDIGFNTPPPPENPLNPQQRAAYDAWHQANPKATPEQLIAFVGTLIGPNGQPLAMSLDNARAIIEARDKGAGVKPGETAVLGLTPEEQAEVDKRVQGTDLVGAGLMGTADTVTMGTVDKLSAAGDALAGSLQGQGAFTDLYGRRSAVENAVQEGVQDEHPWAYGTGQVAGGVALPLFAARTPAQLAKVGAAYGAAYGAGSSDTLAEVPGNVVTGTVTGAATAWGGGKLAEKLAQRGASRAATAAAENTPPTAETAAERYARGKKKFGMDLSVGDVRGMGAKATERLLDVQPGSAGVMNKARGKLGEQIEGAVEGVAGKYGPSTSFRGMGEAAQRGAKSWINKFEETSRKAYEAIPVSAKTPAKLDNTRQALSELTTIFESNPKMAETFKNSRLNRYMEALSEKVRGKPKEVVGEIPEKGLAPANKGSDGKIYVSPHGTSHFHAAEMFPEGVTAKDMGFMSPDGRYLTRTQALKWLDKGGVKVRPSENMSGQLDALDYREQASPSVGSLGRREGGKLSWEDMKAFRSRIGEEIGEQRFSDSPTKSEMRRLYGALSEDMKATAAAQGPQALRAFERANNLYRQGQQRIEGALAKILGDDSMKSPEAAAARIQSLVREGKSSADLSLVHEVWKSLGPEERGEVANGLVRLMGQPVNSEGRAFNPQTFVKNFTDMAPEAKNLIFGGANRELRQNLDEFAKVVGDVAANNSTRNTSNTAMGLAGGFGLFTGGPMGLLGQIAGSYGAARLWTSPKFVKWATGYSKMLRGAERAGRAPNTDSVRTQVRLLDKLAASDPALVQEIAGVRQAVNDNLAKFAAASETDEERKRGSGK